jgi:hypothetical protein
LVVEVWQRRQCQIYESEAEDAKGDNLVDREEELDEAHEEEEDGHV